MCKSTKRFISLALCLAMMAVFCVPAFAAGEDLYDRQSKNQVVSRQTYAQVTDFEQLRDISLSLLNADMIQANEDGSVTVRQLLKEVIYADGSKEQSIAADTLLFMDDDCQPVDVEYLLREASDANVLSDSPYELEGGLLRGSVSYVYNPWIPPYAITFYSNTIWNTTNYVVRWTYDNSGHGDADGARIDSVTGQCVQNSPGVTATKMNLEIGHGDPGIGYPETLLSTTSINPYNATTLHSLNPSFIRLPYDPSETFYSLVKVFFDNGKTGEVGFSADNITPYQI